MQAKAVHSTISNSPPAVVSSVLNNVCTACASCSGLSSLPSPLPTITSNSAPNIRRHLTVGSLSCALEDPQAHSNLGISTVSTYVLSPCPFVFPISDVLSVGDTHHMLRYHCHHGRQTAFRLLPSALHYYPSVHIGAHSLVTLASSQVSALLDRLENDADD